MDGCAVRLADWSKLADEEIGSALRAVDKAMQAGDKAAAIKLIERVYALFDAGDHRLTGFERTN